MALPKGLPQVSDSGKLLGALNYDLVDDSSQRVATTATGSPAAGVFHSSIVGRKPIPDISKDLSVRYGIERIAVQKIAEVQDEFGPNGERVFRALNDDRGLIRFVGSTWTDVVGPAGQYAVNNQTSGSYIEVTFYGTGLNVLVHCYGVAHSYLVSIDGAADTAVALGPFSPVLDNRNYNANQTVSFASGLSIGVHTVRIKANSATFNFAIDGFDIIGPSATLTVQPGSAYIDANRVTLAAQQLPAYASGFTNVYGTAGTRGGRVLVYLASDGAVKKDIQYVDTAAAYSASANHTNEEVIRTHYPREFGAGRTDDFSIVAPGGSASLAFTLDDGTTTLTGLGVGFANEGISTAANNGFIQITFVGTGLDVERFDDANSAGPETQYTYSVDGVSQGSFGATGSTLRRIQKIVSGLPYGTHTVRISRGTPIYFTPRFSKFIVYGPKKPTLPTGAVELADYNVMANYIFNASYNLSTSTGTLLKSPSREMIYIGTLTLGLNISPITGIQISSAASANAQEYTFFGTGIEFQIFGNSAGVAVGIQIDGVNYAGTPSLVGPVSWASPNLTWSSIGGAVVSITGLSLGSHKIRITTNNANAMSFLDMAVITPVHSPKSSLYGDIQNTLPIGSCAISDNRVTTTSVNTNSIKPKAWAQAVGVSISPTTSATFPNFVPCPDLSVTITTKGTALDISYSAMFEANAVSGINNNTNAVSLIFVDGVSVGTIRFETFSIAASCVNLSDSIIVPVAPGTHKVDVYWCKDGLVTTLAANNNRRTLTVREL